MPLIRFIASPQNRVSGEPIVPGRVIYTYDGRIFWDAPDGKRIEMTDIQEIQTEYERSRIQTPAIKFYYVIETDKLYRYTGAGWLCLNPDWDFIGTDGRIRAEVLPDTAVILGENRKIPVDQLPLATKTTPGVVTLGSEGGAARYGYPEDVGLGNVTNDAQVKAKDLQTTEPTYLSTDTQVTSARRLWLMLGDSVANLLTTSKSIIGALNELFRDKLGKNERAADSAKLNGLDAADYLRSPESQSDPHVLIAPSQKGALPSLKPLSEFIQTTGDNAIAPSDDSPLPNGTADPGKSMNYARADHVHPKSDVPLPSNAIPKGMGEGSPGTSDKYAREDHIHPISQTIPFETSAEVFQMDGIASAGTSNTVARADHTHPTDTTRASTDLATEMKAGLMSPQDKIKLNGIHEGAKPSDNSPKPMGMAASPGTDDHYARADHVHPLPASIPVASNDMPQGLNPDGSPGTSDRFARADHVHPSPAIPNPGTATPSAPAKIPSAGSSGRYAREDHVHPLPTLGQINAVNLNGDTMKGILVAQNNTEYTTKQVRNIIISTEDPSGGENGDIWFKIEV